MDARASLELLNTVQRLAETGRYAALVEQLGALPVHDVEASPTLALLFGIAQARLGRTGAGRQWVRMAVEQARARGDGEIEARALNVLGGIAFYEGWLDEAVSCITRALAAAERQGDRATVGRCCNNLGSVAHLRGEYGRAVGSYTMALAAFQQAGLRSGVAETLHNLAITYRDQQDMATALETEERALHEATAAGDLALAAKIQGGRAEIRLLMGDAELARREIQRALAAHRELGNVVGEAEDLHVLAGVLAQLGQPAEAEALLRDIIARSQTLQQPLLLAQAERDLARLLAGQRRDDEMAQVAGRARERFEKLGAVIEVRHLEELLAGHAA
jgi:tetratricopeptide (TPR) repeat protein